LIKKTPFVFCPRAAAWAPLRFASGFALTGEAPLQTGHGIPWPVFRCTPASGREGEQPHRHPRPHRRGGLHAREHQEPRVHLLQAGGADPQGGGNGGGEDFAVHAQICRAFTSHTLTHPNEWSICD